MPASRPSPLLRDLLPCLLLLAAGTVFFRLTPADITWTNPWRDGNDWLHGDDFPWSVLYHLGTYPALIAVLGALAVLLAGCRLARWARFRRQAVYLVLVMAVGPGLVTNAILKDHWGRPRPRDVDALGGMHPYEPLLTIDLSSPGKSFPCGHATMGFFFFAFYFLLRRHRPGWARAVLGLALVYGLAIGWARVVQGGHFPSDVLWAGGVIWMVAALLAHWLKAGEIPELHPDFRPLSWGRLSLLFLLVPALIFLVLLATPMDRKDTFSPARPPAGPAELRLQIPFGETILESGADWRIDARSHGFGLPGSGLKPVWKEETESDGTPRLELKQRVSGLTTEINQTLHAVIPPDKVRRIHLTQDKGVVRLKLPSEPAPAGPRRWLIELGEGDLEIISGGQPFRVRRDGTRSGPDGAQDEIDLRIGPGVTTRIPGE